ncbi:MAG: hypothetical protein ACM34B_18340 [Nitrospira sp.]
MTGGAFAGRWPALSRAGEREVKVAQYPVSGGAEETVERSPARG